MTVERIVALISGESGSGKSFFVANLHNALIYDTDIGGGLSYADARIAKNKSERVQIGSYPEILEDLRRRHLNNKLNSVLTLVIDHLSSLHQEACIRHNPRDERDFGRSSDIATREWRRIREFARTQDFNLIVTSHLKAKWENEKAVGTIADAGKNLEGDMSIVLEVRRTNAYPSLAWVKKWRRDPLDERGLIPSTFPFALEAFEKLAGIGLATPREPAKFATTEQIEKINNLVAVAKLPEGIVEKWFKKAGVEQFAEMTAGDIAKCINYIEELLNTSVKPLIVKGK